MAGEITCPSCGQGTMKNFYEVRGVPTNSCILLDSADEARAYPRGHIVLGFCPHCGFISNVAFDEKLTEYSGRYEETQGFSGTFNKFHKQLAERLIDRYDLHGKDVLEIGCGKGEFLYLLSSLGGNRGVGFDPGYHPGRFAEQDSADVQFITDFYSEKYADYKADFVCCKMTLEHIHETGDFIGTVRKAIGERHDTVVFFQIPEVMRILTECAFEDVYYEHCSYFSPGSLGRLFRRAGFKVLNIETEYDSQYLTVEAVPASDGDLGALLPIEESLETLAAEVDSFTTRCAEKRREWETRVRATAAAGRKVVLWGSGSKGVSFLTSLDVNDAIEYVVDINPYRHGHYMSGTGQKIVSPEFLKEYQPDLVVIMNRVYSDEISQSLQQMGVSAEVAAL